MSAVLIAASVLCAALLALAIVAALRSYENTADHVSEYTRTRLYAAHPYGIHEPGRQATAGERRERS